MSITVSGGGGGLPVGIQGDGRTPGGLVVDGGISQGDPSDVAASSTQFNGVVTLWDTTGNAASHAAIIGVQQAVDLGQDETNVALGVFRHGTRNGFTYTHPASLISVGGASDGEIVMAVESNVGAGSSGYSRFIALQINAKGFIAMNGKTPPTAPRALPQATIDAITDANAKAAVQACANALADMGALTLT